MGRGPQQVLIAISETYSKHIFITNTTRVVQKSTKTKKRMLIGPQLGESSPKLDLFLI